MSIRKKFFPIRVDEPLHREIKLRAMKLGIPMNQLVVKIIEDYLATNLKRLIK